MSIFATVIQGPTTYFREMSAAFGGQPGVVWCTWSSEPEAALAAIRAAGIELHLIEKPVHPGKVNVNFQCRSTFFGIEYCREKFGADRIVKVRSDLAIGNFGAFREWLAARPLAEGEVCSMGRARGLDGPAFFLDFIVWGKAGAMAQFWHFDDRPENGHPFPERWLEQRFTAQGGQIRSEWSEKIEVRSLKYALWNQFFGKKRVFVTNSPPERLRHAVVKFAKKIIRA